MADALTVDEYEPDVDTLDFLGDLPDDQAAADEAEDWLAEIEKEEDKTLRFAARQQLGSSLVEYEAALLAGRRHGVSSSPTWPLASAFVHQVAVAMDAVDSTWKDAGRVQVDAYAETVGTAREQLREQTRLLRRAITLAAARSSEASTAIVPLVGGLPHAGPRQRPRERRTTASTRAGSRDGPSSDDDPLPQGVGRPQAAVVRLALPRGAA